jgi:hypothetical protein
VKAGAQSLVCSEEAFEGTDPKEGEQKVCFCDQERKFFSDD